MKKTYQGGCHCGAVRYEVELDLADGTMRCNCSICSKLRNWLAMARPEQFRLLAGEGELSDYGFGAKRIHHLFCRHCGVHSFGWGNLKQMGGKVYAVNVNCLDHLTPAELAAVPVQFIDGRQDNWTEPPAETRHL